METTKKKLGRPVGSKNGVSVRNWQPKKWNFEYETILLMHICGKSEAEISEVNDYSVGQINNILNSELCKQRKEQLIQKLGVVEVMDKYKRIMEMGLKRMKEFIEDDGHFEKTPLAAIDRGIKIFELMNGLINGKPGGGPNGGVNVTNNTLVLASEPNVAKLLKATEWSNRVAEIHGSGLDLSNIPTANNNGA